MVFFPPPSPENQWDSDEEEDGLAEQAPLDVHWVPVHTFHIAVCSLPGNRLVGARRSLVADLETVKNAGIQDVFVLCSDSELARCKVSTLLVDYVGKQMTPHHYPICDDHMPDVRHWLRVLEDLHCCLQNGRRTLVHCQDGYGRSCLLLVLLSLLMDEDLPAEAAIETIRQHRGPPAVQTVKQYNFITDFRKNLAEFQRQQVAGQWPQEHHHPATSS